MIGESGKTLLCGQQYRETELSVQRAKEGTFQAKEQAVQRSYGRNCRACLRNPRRMSGWSRGRDRERVGEESREASASTSCWAPGPSEKWGLICKIALTCCSAKFLHLTLGVGDLSLSVHINALYFLMIAEMSIV